MKHALGIILISLIVLGCKQSNKPVETADEGIITYEAHYFTSEKDNPIIALLPNKVELRFKNNNISLTSEGYLGFFSTKFISIYKSDTSRILLKILNNKFNYEFPQNEVAFIYNQLPPKSIDYIDSTQIIAGYECKMAKLNNYSNSTHPINVFYTNDIGLKKPNRNTPLHKIPGVLMQFETTINKVHAKFVAQSVRFEPIPEEEFLVPKEYKKADLATLKKYIVDFN
jgi:hypothetical protein